MLMYLMSMAHVLLAYLDERIETLLNTAEHGLRDEYLASCADIGQLERRMRAIEGDA
ncbi:DUF3563 family protein [Paraburkholderia phymatum]|uniref:DUF3563 family protein n=1 Tax=Paraburkholderia phymatum TaxID=148447 RepID=UPI00316AEE8C